MTTQDIKTCNLIPYLQYSRICNPQSQHNNRYLRFNLSVIQMAMFISWIFVPDSRVNHNLLLNVYGNLISPLFPKIACYPLIPKLQNQCFYHNALLKCYATYSFLFTYLRLRLVLRCINNTLYEVYFLLYSGLLLITLS